MDSTRVRSNTYHPVTDQWIKDVFITGEFMNVKDNGRPFKQMRKKDD